MSQLLNPFDLESLRIQLSEKLAETSSYNFKLFLISNFINKIISANNQKFFEAFVPEFIDEYLSALSHFEVTGTNPELTEKIIFQAKETANKNLTVEYKNNITAQAERIEEEYKRLLSILNGEEFEAAANHKAQFPLIDKEAPEEFYGIIESVTIHIKKSDELTKFIIVPSETEIEQRIYEQCKASWDVAIEQSKKYIKNLHKNHEVIISFDKKAGFYIGNSLGIALTLSFITEILKLYNPAYLINISQQISCTGGINLNGEVICTGEEIIKRKVAAVFFSDIRTFVIPKIEESYAYFTLTQLKEKYPARRLKLVSVEDINDILNRRDIVEIRKQRAVVRASKFIRKNWISAVTSILIAVLVTLLNITDLDDNPAIVTSDGAKAYVRNKNGKILWSEDFKVSEKHLPITNILKSNFLIFDAEGDGKNEVLYKPQESLEVICYNYKKEVLWKYRFRDKVNSLRENLNDEYDSIPIDTLTFHGIKSILLRSSNRPSFASSIFRLNAKTGERLPSTFWASGHIMDCLIKDVDNDGKMDIIGTGADNGFKDLVFFVKQIDTLNSVRPTTKEYQINNFPLAELKVCIRFPKIDYQIYQNHYTPNYMLCSLQDKNEMKYFSFATSYYIDYSPALEYRVDYNFKEIDIIVASTFAVIRDSLVAKGILNLPYTDTKEYIELVKSKILYWQADSTSESGGRWVKREELE